ncbi:MAG: energy-coupling factor transporter transmembrane protein EcfT [Herbiconiux sp.]|uniref:energy-coupling factor transporter transmembrane component T family protein n=1 Tax=Herbiconiux sp. TaxID=1871186 RepID=UPI00121D8459|nr:energy-coupling factor transporter transmembrane component T [Herbiconiux sp.]TAJ48821.1 MAG: energy-coupling factor transporter transmembrane protein EcfT [Herbiconiux sp.]
MSGAETVRDSPLARRNPTVKLAVLFLASVALLFVLDPVTPSVVYLLGLIGVIVGGRLPLRTVLAAQLPFLAFAVGVFSINVLSRPGTVVWQEGPLRVTVDGLIVGAALAVRTLAIGILSIGFVLTTDSLALMTSLHQNAHLGARPSYALMAGYRLLQQLPGEWTAIRDAQAVRAPLRRNGSVHRTPASFGRAAFTLLVLAIRRGERMAQSLESRGLGLQPRTVWNPVRVGSLDVVFGASIVAGLGVVIGIAGLLGVLRGPGALF